MDVVAKPQESDESDPGSSDAEEVLETAKDSAHLNGQENQKPSSKTRVASQPQLFSADDSHAFWPQPNTAWLLSAASKRTTTDPSNGKEHSGLGVLYSGPHADAHVGKTYDVARMSMTQLLAAAAKHSKGRGIPEEPVKQYLYGYRGQVVPERDAYPFTLGGSNARKHAGSARAWQVLAGYDRKDRREVREAQEQKKVTRPSKQQAAPAVTYTMTPTFTTEQEEFNAALGGFLGVPGPVKLPLMAPGAAVLDLKALLLKVVELGGAKQVDSQRKWRDVARALRQGTEHAGAVREVYMTYLKPVEAAMATTHVRPARIQLWLSAKASERKADKVPEESVRPLAEHVQQAQQHAEAALRKWNSAHGGTRLLPRLAVQLVRDLAVLPHATSANTKSSDPKAAGLIPTFKWAVPAVPGAEPASGGLASSKPSSRAVSPDEAPAATPAAGSGAGKQETGTAVTKGAKGKQGAASSKEANGKGDGVRSGTEKGKEGGAAGRGTLEEGAEDQGAAQKGSAEKTGSPDGEVGEQKSGKGKAGKRPRERERPVSERSCKKPKEEPKTPAPRVPFTTSASQTEANLPASMSWSQAQPLLALAISMRETRAAVPQPPDIPAYFAAQYQRLKGEPWPDALPAMPCPATLPRVYHEPEKVKYPERRPPPSDEEEDSDESSGEEDEEGGEGEEGGKRKKRGKGRKKKSWTVTPKCGTCKTCSNPMMKKACVTNRERVAKGLKPVVGKS